MFIIKDKCQSLFNEVLIKPFQRCNELCIVSGYASAAMVEQQLIALKENFQRDDLKISLIVGMTPSSGISEAQHKNFLKFSKKKDFSCSYIHPTAEPIHSKLYIWKSSGAPVQAFISSANYTANAFLNRQGEVAAMCDPVAAYRYFQWIIPASIYCDHPEANGFIIPEQEIWKK